MCDVIEKPDITQYHVTQCHNVTLTHSHTHTHSHNKLLYYKHLPVVARLIFNTSVRFQVVQRRKEK
jgi:hypothetical protein